MIALLAAVNEELRKYFPSSATKCFASKEAAILHFVESKTVPYSDVLNLILKNHETMRKGALAANENAMPGVLNWTLRKQTEAADGNSSKEVLLEREFAGNEYWFNKTPAVSGLFRPDMRQAQIDLAFARDRKKIEYIELKVKSNNPLYAAMEHLAYAVAWIYARKHAITLGYLLNDTLRDGLSFDEVTWTVLAPSDFYNYRRGNVIYSYHLDSFATGMSKALSELANQHLGETVKLNFGFQAFDSAILDQPKNHAKEIIKSRYQVR